MVMNRFLLWDCIPELSNQNSKGMSLSLSYVVGKHNELIHMLDEQYSSVTAEELRRWCLQGQVWVVFDSEVKHTYKKTFIAKTEETEKKIKVNILK